MAKVLIVDDEKGIREAYGKLVSQMEHEVFTAKNNEEANAIVLTTPVAAEGSSFLASSSRTSTQGILDS